MDTRIHFTGWLQLSIEMPRSIFAIYPGSEIQAVEENGRTIWKKSPGQGITIITDEPDPSAVISTGRQ